MINVMVTDDMVASFKSESSYKVKLENPYFSSDFQILGDGPRF